MLYIIILAAILLISFDFLWKVNYWKTKKVKFVTPLPLFGNYLQVFFFQTSLPEKIQSLYNNFPNERYCGIFKLTAPFLLIRDIDLIKEMLIKNHGTFKERPQMTWPSVDTIFNNSLFESKGEKWKKYRKITHSYFNSVDNLNSFHDVIAKCACGFIEFVKDSPNTIIELKIKSAGAKFASNVLTKLCFGISCNSLKPSEETFYLKGKKLININGFRRTKLFVYPYLPESLSKILNIKIFSDDVETFFTSLVRQAKLNPDKPKLIEALESDKTNTKLYEEDERLLEEEVTGQLMGLLFSGMDSSATLISLSIYELAVNPHVQQKLREEITAINKNSSGNIKYNDVVEATYLDMVLCELSRKYLGTEMERVCTESFEIPAKLKGETTLKIKKGDLIVVPYFAIQRDEKFFPQPDLFDPERFSAENRDKIKPGTYFPFGLGPRSCVAGRFSILQCKVFLVHLLRAFEIITLKSTQIPLRPCTKSLFFNVDEDVCVGLKSIH